MAASELVADIAKSIARTRAPLTPREAYLIHVLQGTPLHRDIGRLDLWERSYRQVIPEHNLTDTEQLIDATFWLPGEFLYGAYIASEARKYFFDTLQPLLRRFDIYVELASETDLLDW